MNRHLDPLAAILAVVFATVLVGLPAFAQDNLTWTGSVNNVWDIDTTANWTGDDTVFNNGDNVTFSGGSNTDPINIAGTVRIGSMNITTTGGPFVFSGGTIRYDFNNTVTSLSFGDGPLRLDGATVWLNFLGTSWGHELSFTTPAVIGSSGGTFNVGPEAAGQRRYRVTVAGDVSLGGDLTIAGNAHTNNMINWPRITGTVTLTDNASITNAMIRDTNAIPVEIRGQLAGATRTLTLNTTNGEGFTFFDPTATSLNVHTIQANANIVRTQAAANWDPMDQLTANGGGLIMGAGTSYTITRGDGNLNTLFRPSNVTWEGNNTLRLIGTGWDSAFTVLENLAIGGAGNNLTALHYQPFRGGMTMQAGTTLTIGDEGLFRVTVARDDGVERTNGNITLLDGAVVEGINTAGTLRGGLVRNNAGTLTLGDGSASTITIRGNTGTKVQYFAMGYDSFTTDSGEVTLRYESTGTAGQSFNIAWTPGGNTRANAVEFRGGSGGTIFAPGAASISVVGPDADTVFVANSPTSLVTAGTVGFYNGAAGSTDASRGALARVS